MIYFIILYIVSIPICAFLMLALTANWVRSNINRSDIGIGDILYNDKFNSEKKRCSLLAIVPIANLTIVFFYYIIQLLRSDIKLTTPIDKIFKKLYRTKYLLNRIGEEI